MEPVSEPMEQDTHDSSTWEMLLTAFLMQYHGVDHLAEIKPYARLGPNAVPCWQPARDVTIKVTFTGPGESYVPVEKVKQPRQPFNELTYNTDLATVTGIYINYARSRGTGYHVQCNFVPKPMETAMEAQDRAREAAGMPPRLVANIFPKTDAAQDIHAMRSSIQNFLLHEGFVKTMAYLNRENIMHGIIQLPPDIVATLPKYAQITDLEGQQVSIDISSYVLIPEDHVLAWKLHLLDHYRCAEGYYAIDFVVNPRDNPKERFVQYYIVCDHSFNRLMQEYAVTWVDNVDKRPVQTVGFKFTPIEKVGDTDGVEIDTIINYTCFPNMTDEMVAQQIIPSLHPNFIPFEMVLQQQKQRRSN